MIRLEPVRGYRRCCGRCGQLTAAIHDREELRIRDLPLFEHWVELRVLRVRVECPIYGPKLERLAWLAAYAGVTRRLAESAAQLCKVIKGARWLLLTNRDALGPAEEIKLEELLAANQELFVVYVLRDALRELWQHREPERALRAWYSLPLAPRDQPHRGHQQQDQGYQAHGTRLPRRRLLLPQDPGRLP